MNDTLAVEARAIEKTYRLGFGARKVVRALKGLDLKIRPGEIFGLIGPNGAGKSTAIKILMNLVQASNGTATIFGRDVRMREARRGLGYVPENPTPYEYLSGREFVTYSARLCGVPSSELEQRVKESLDRVNLTRAADLRIRRYSKGMTQRAVIAAALASKPKLLVLDEPTSGLDPVGRRLIRDLILEERQKGTTVIFCTHIISDVETLCDRLAVLLAGQCVKEGTVASLLSGDAPKLEVVIAGLSAEALGKIPGTSAITPASERLLATVSESDLQGVIGAVIAAGGQVLRITPLRFSLEDMFMQTLQGFQGPAVGGEIE
ncbi:MAG: ABC transporter ATP-binding protein [Archangiaceae bacterium]|nr:ABC transporter ATP-binding protein [Archangiaceae bacterium]